MHFLADSREAFDRRKEALEMREKVVALYEKRGVPKHPEAIGAKHNLAISLHGAGDLEKAIKLQGEVLALRREVERIPNHPDTLAAMHTLATFYFDSGDKGKALRMREEVVKISKAIRPKHPDTIAAMHNLAISIFEDVARRNEALEMRRLVKDLSTEVNGPDHPNTLEAMRCLAISREAGGGLDEAFKLLGEMDLLRVASFPPARATLVPPDSEWTWFHPTDGIDPGDKVQGFQHPDFDDSGWQANKDGLNRGFGYGYGHSFEGVNIGTPASGQRCSAFFRRKAARSTSPICHDSSERDAA